MKYIVIGLGYFGSALAIRLTSMGNEVIGIDRDFQKIEAVKDRITHCVGMDSTDLKALSTLPLEDTDVVIVAIGEDFGASLMTMALLKQVNVKRLICRAISPLHKGIIEAMGVGEVIMPEQESAEHLAEVLDMKNVLNTFELAEGHGIVEVRVPANLGGRTIGEIDFRGNYRLNIVTIKKKQMKKNIIGVSKETYVVTGVVTPDTRLETEDIIVLFGASNDLRDFLKKREEI
jgi:trk system potassium uptake protein